MTQHQYCTLRFLIDHNVKVEGAGIYNLCTLGSLLARKWVTRKGDHIVPTNDGLDAYNSFHTGGPNFRKHAGELSQRVRLMLHLRALAASKNGA